MAGALQEGEPVSLAQPTPQTIPLHHPGWHRSSFGRNNCHGFHRIPGPSQPTAAVGKRVDPCMLSVAHDQLFNWIPVRAEAAAAASQCALPNSDITVMSSNNRST